MAVGISTSCYYPMETEQAVQSLIRANIRDAELFFNARCETSGTLLASIKQIQNEGSLRIHSVHPYFSFAESYMFFSPYHRRMLDGLEAYKELCDACHELGADFIVMHGEKEPFRISEDEYIERYAKIEEAVCAEGITLTQENVVHYRAQDPVFLRKIRTALGDRFHMTLDVKQAVRSGENPLSLAEEFAGNIVHVHVSDHGEKGDCLAPGQGNFDFEKLFRVLHQSSYIGQYMIELYRASYSDERELLDSHKKLQKILEKALQNDKFNDTIK